jgi:6-phosphogluconolactonase
MLTRRLSLSLMAAAAATPRLAVAQRAHRAVAAYANVGPELTSYAVDVAAGTLSRTGSVTLPADVQYAWPHRSGRMLYVVSSNGASGAAGRHYATAIGIDPASGKLLAPGISITLPARPINVTTDIPSRHVLIAFNQPSGVRIFQVTDAMLIGPEVAQPAAIDGGIYAHQIRVTLDNRHAILVTRGNDATPTAAEDPGALKFFDYANGVLSHEISVAPNKGIGFGPRHLDFHPTKPWIYVSLERESKMLMFEMTGGTIGPDVVYSVDTVVNPANKDPRQLAGTIHFNPNGRFVYVANRADGTVDVAGKKVFRGGENSIVVFAVDPKTGKPTAIQSIDTQKFYPRTFHIDPSGRLLVAEHNIPMLVRDGSDVRQVQAGLSVFAIGADGKLTFLRTYDVDVGQQTMFWMGMVAL